MSGQQPRPTYTVWRTGSLIRRYEVLLGEWSVGRTVTLAGARRLIAFDRNELGERLTDLGRQMVYQEDA